MTRARLVLALLISVGLIGGATLFRLSGVTAEEAGLYIAKGSGDTDISSFYENVPLPVVGIVSSSSVPTTETDLIGPQLLLGLVDLAANGQASDVNIQKIADQNVEVINSLISVRKIGVQDLKITDNSSANFQSYYNQALPIYTSYSKRISLILEAFQEKGMPQPEIATMAASAANLYWNTAQALQKVPTPYDISTEHLVLINILYEEAASMEALGGLYRDSATAFSGLIKINQLTQTEQDAVIALNKILKRYGL